MRSAVIYSRHLCEHFRPMGYSYNKCIPRWVFDLDSTYLDVLFQWLMWGDGHAHKDTKRPVAYYTCSKQLADDVQRLCLHTKRAGTVRIRWEPGMPLPKGSVIRGRRVFPVHTQYEVRIISTKLEPTINHGHVHKQKVQKELWISYSGSVWCCTLDKHNIVYVRRNGKSCWCGNSTSFGSKGIVAKIIKDEDMPRDSEGRPLEILFSPMGIASRTNSALVLTAALGKVADKTGKRYLLPGFSKDSQVEFVKKELAKNGVPFTEDIFDPTKGVTVPNVFTGKLYVYKMQQTAESKAKGQATEAYSQEDIPDGKHYGDMEWSALLGHKAVSNIKDIKLIKGRRNDDFWRQLKMGETPTMPGTPPVYEKFKESLKAAGINIAEDKNRSHIFAMTNKQAEDLTQGNELTTADTYSAKDFAPIPGGLFDADKTLSLSNGKKWAYYKLPEPLPNPVMEEPIRAFLGVTKKDFEKIISGDLPLQGKTGGQAIKDYLSRLSLQDVVATAENTIKSGSTSKRDAAVKLLKYAKAMQKEGVRPEDFMMDRVPVLPPAYRPITQSGSMTMVADPNYMYKALVDSIQDYKDSEKLPTDLRNKARGELYKSYAALVGTQDPSQAELQEKKVGGVLDQILGKSSPKLSMYQRRVLGSNMDLYGLSAISLNPSLKVNQVGIPESKAWDIYSPFIVRALIQQGETALGAATAVKTKSPKAYSALQKVVTERPVLINRAPTLHKYSIMAAWPVLTKGDTMQLPPAICKSLGADYDGDAHINHVLTKFSSDAMLWVNETYGVSYLQSRKIPMTSKQKLMVKTGECVCVMNLEDFPHPAEYQEKTTDKSTIKFFPIPKGIEVMSYDKDGNVVWSPVTSWSEHTGIELEIVNLKSGKQIVTDDDPRAVFGVSEDSLVPARFTPSEAVLKKVSVPVAKGLTVTDTVKEVSAKDYNIPTAKMFLKDSITLDESFGYLLGALVGDGWISYVNNEIYGQFNMSGSETNVLNKFSQCVANLFVDAYPEPGVTSFKKDVQGDRHGDCLRYTYSHKGASKFLASLTDRGASNKGLPSFYLSSPVEFRNGLLSGLLDTDGSISVSNGKKRPQLLANFTSTSIRMIQEVQLLAKSLNIASTITPFKYGPGKSKDAWLLNFSTVDFVKWTGNSMVCAHKIEHLKNKDAWPDEDSGASVRNDLVPVTKDITQALKELSSADRKLEKGIPEQNKLYAAIHTMYAEYSGYCTRYLAKKLIQKYGHVLEQFENGALWIKLVANTAVKWDLVESVTKTGIKETGYDLTVPGSETFMNVEGVILSNTMTYSVPVSDAAVKEAKEKMTPEKNLLSIANDKPMYQPSQEYNLGGYLMSKEPAKEPVQVFRSWQDAVQAYKQGKIKVDTPVKVTG